MISVLVIDDHPIILEGSKALFQEEKDIAIQTESDPELVMKHLKQEKFDVFLIDVNIAKKNGMTLATEIKAVHKNSVVILYTGADLRCYYPLLLERKVDGILSKVAPREQYIQTIRAAVKGNLVIPFDFLDYLSNGQQDGENLKLTKREKYLVQMLLKGDTNKIMAEQLNVSERTIERYLSSLFRVLSVKTREEAIEFVEKYDLLSR